MDCRRLLLLAPWVLGCLPGCSHEVVTVPIVPPNVAAQPASVKPTAVAVAPVTKEADLPPRQPKAATCVAGGDFFAREAVVPGHTKPEQEHCREEARKAYQQALSIDPNHLPGYLGLARLYIQMEDYPHAVATYRSALKVAPRDASLWFELGMCYGRQKDWSGGLEGLTKAAELDPENRRYVNTLGYALAWVGRYPDSLQCFGRVMSEAKAHYNLARVLQRQQQTDLARQHLQLALQQDPQDSESQELLAVVEGRPAAPLQTVTHTDSKPNTTADASPNTPPAALPVILPPPPTMAARKPASPPQ
jgi:Tfp pilus assembly protein PilF